MSNFFKHSNNKLSSLKVDNNSLSEIVNNIRFLCEESTSGNEKYYIPPGISAIVRAIDYDGTQNEYFVSKLELMGNIMNIICSPMTGCDLVAGTKVMVKNINGNKYDNNWMLRIYAAYGRVINIDYLGECDLENIDWENITMFDYADHIIPLSRFNSDKLDEIVGSENDFGFLGAGWKVNKTITA